MLPAPSHRNSQPLPHPLGQLHLPKLPHIQQPLLAQFERLDGADVLHGRSADAAGDDDGVGLEDDAVVDDFVDAEGDEVVVFDDGAFVG